MSSLALLLSACSETSVNEENAPSDESTASTQGYSPDPEVFVSQPESAPQNVSEEDQMWTDIYLELNVGQQDYLLMVNPTPRGIEMVDSFVETYPDSANLEKAMYLAAISRWQSYDYLNAATKYGEYVAKYPNRSRSSLAMTRYADSLLRSDQPELALQVVETFKNAPSARQREWIRAEALAVTGRTDEARKIIMDWMYSAEAAAANPLVVTRVQQLLDRINAMGTQIPDFAFSDALTGARVTSDDYKGKVVLVDFWKSTCNPCMTELPLVLDLYEKYRNAGFEVVTINMDDQYTNMQNAADVIAADWPISHDGLGWQSPIVTAFGATRTPHTILVDRNGVIKAVNVRIKTIERLVPKLLAEPTD
jgi:thiol-disulfide isomerase/thioredoxin